MMTNMPIMMILDNGNFFYPKVSTGYVYHFDTIWAGTVIFNYGTICDMNWEASVVEACVVDI